MYKQHKIGIVILAYNVEYFLRSTIEGLPELVDRIYVVDDGSSDNTAKEAIALSNSKVFPFRHDRNKGPGAAMSTGCKLALEEKMDVVVKLDGDGQMRLEQIENLIMPIIDGKADYTKGDRLSNPDDRRNMPRFRLFGNFLLTRLTRLASGYRHLNDTQNGFVAISKKALESINIETVYPYYGYLNDILVRLKVGNFIVQDIPMPAKYDKEKSSIKLKNYIIKVSFMLLNRYIWRLKMKHFTSPEVK